MRNEYDWAESEAFAQWANFGDGPRYSRNLIPPETSENKHLRDRVRKVERDGEH
jgi:hypothetical protein